MNRLRDPAPKAAVTYEPILALAFHSFWRNDSYLNNAGWIARIRWVSLENCDKAIELLTQQIKFKNLKNLPTIKNLSVIFKVLPIFLNNS